jgi:hypothetical protein
MSIRGKKKNKNKKEREEREKEENYIIGGFNHMMTYMCHARIVDQS